MFCNLVAWDDALLAENEDAKEMWNDAWVMLGACAPISLEEVMEEELTNGE